MFFQRVGYYPPLLPNQNIRALGLVGSFLPTAPRGGPNHEGTLMSNETIKPMPQLSPELIEALDARFPNRSPSLKMSDREVWAAAGAAGVVGFLRVELQRQKDEAGL